MPSRVVLDTNVIVAGLQSRLGASFQVLSLVGTGAFELCLSVPLVLEYEDALKRRAHEAGLAVADIDAVLDYLCAVASKRSIFFLWRPYLKDPGDDMVLEVAVEAECQFIVTFNLRDFVGIERFGLKALTPRQFLHQLGRIP